MKKFIFSFLTCITVAWLLSGCSKKDSDTSKTSSSAAQLTGPAVELKMKWNLGKKYVQHMQMTQSSKMNMGGQPMQQKTDMSSDYSVSVVKELPANGRDLELEFLAQKMEVSMGDQAVASFDSASDPSKDADNPAAPVLRKMIGAQIHYLTDADGKVQKVTGFNEFMDRFGDTPQAAMMKGMFSEDMLKQYCDFGRGLPDHPVKVGEQWPLKLEVPMGPIGTLSLNLNYTFKGWEQHDGRNCARLEYTGNITSKAASTAPAGMSFDIESGKISGVNWFDPELGMMIENNSDQDMVIKIKAQGRTMDSAVGQKTSLKLVAVTDVAK